MFVKIRISWFVLFLRNHIRAKKDLLLVAFALFCKLKTELSLGDHIFTNLQIFSIIFIEIIIYQLF